MKKFWKKSRREENPSWQPDPPTELELAEQEVNAADEKMQAARKRIQDLQHERPLIVDHTLQIQFLGVRDPAEREVIVAEVEGHRREFFAALREFHDACNRYAGLKNSKQGGLIATNR